MQAYETLKHTTWECKYNVYNEVPEESPVWANPAGVGAGFSGTGAAEGMRDH